MEDLSIVRVAGIIPPKLLDSWSRLYCEIWKEPPWNEDFWQPDSVAQELSREMGNRDALAFLAVDHEEVVGFTHGYSVTRQALEAIAGNKQLDFLFKESELVYYIDELGISSRYRSRGISLRLTRPLIEWARMLDVGGITLRTDIQAVAARHVYQKLGFNELLIHDTAHPSRTYWFLE